MINPSQKLSQVSTYYFAKKLAEIDQMNKQNDIKVINLGIGSPDIMPHKDVISTLQNDANKHDAHPYQSYKGMLRLRQAFTSWYKFNFDVNIDPETEILPLMGSKEGVMHISMAFLDRGDQVLVPNPGYPAYGMCTKLAGATEVDMPLMEDLGWRPDLDKLAGMDLSKVKLMWLNYPNMPTGAKVNKAFFDEVIAFAKAYNIMVCHDNPYAFILNTDPISILGSDPSKEHSLELTSLSKFYNMSGWRVGAVSAHAQVIEHILTFKSNMDSGMFRPIQEAAITALSLSNDWFDTLNLEYKRRKTIAAQIMNLLGLTFDIDSAGLFIWGKIRDNTDAIAKADAILYGAKVFITPGTIFGSQGSRHLRISLCSSTSSLSEALDRISHFVSSQHQAS
jgi:LL-diaminopimelate aminotransferase